MKYTSYVTTVAGSNEFHLPFLVTQVSCLSRIAHCVRCAVPKGIFQFQYSMLWKLGEEWSWLEHSRQSGCQEGIRFPRTMGIVSKKDPGLHDKSWCPYPQEC